MDIRIAVADDEALFRKGIIKLLQDYNLQLSIEVSNGKELINQLRETTSLPDVLLLDLNMPDMDGIEAAKIIQKEFPNLPFIVLSSYHSKAFIINMIELGASAYLTKSANPEDMVHTIKEVIEKGFYYDHQVIKILRENVLKKTRPTFKTPFGISLSDREKEVLQLICEEFTTPEIAEKLFISPRTVDGHRNNLLQKLNCRNTAGLVLIAIQEEIVDIKKLRFK